MKRLLRRSSVLPWPLPCATLDRPVELSAVASVAAAWARGLDFRCGCFGKVGAASIGAQKFAENLALTLLAALASRRERG